jgi:hypothetical protein
MLTPSLKPSDRQILRRPHDDCHPGADRVLGSVKRGLGRLQRVGGVPATILSPPARMPDPRQKPRRGLKRAMVRGDRHGKLSVADLDSGSVDDPQIGAHGDTPCRHVLRRTAVGNRQQRTLHCTAIPQLTTLNADPLAALYCKDGMASRRGGEGSAAPWLQFSRRGRIMGKRLIASFAAAVLTVAFAATPATASSSAYNFSGSYAPAHWTTTLTGTPAGGGVPAGVDASGAPSTITIRGGDGVPPGGTDCWDDNLSNPRKGCAIFYTFTASVSGTVGFDWDYESFDNSSSAIYDVFGYVVDGLTTQVTNDGGPIAQNGSVSFDVVAGQTFGFWVDCGDCGYGNAVVSIRGFTAPAPAAAAIPALGIAELAVLASILALLAMAFLRRAV